MEHFAVDWILVGPLALAAYGGPWLGNETLDVLPALGEENLAALAHALEALGAVAASGEATGRDAGPRPADLWPADADRLTREFVTRAGRIAVADPTAYARVATTARTAVLGGVKVRVAHPYAAHPPHLPPAPGNDMDVPAAFPAHLTQPL